MEQGPSAVVLGVGGAAGVSAISLLGRRRVRVYAVDHQRSPLGFRSRYAASRRVPNPERDESAFVAALATLGDELGGSVPILPARDEDLNALARARPDLGGRFLYPFPTWEILGPIQEKRFQVRRASELGLAVPNTVDDPARVTGFPVLVKPSRPAGFRARFRRQALLCETRAELKRAFALAAAFDPLIQEVISGPDRMLFTVGAYIDENGEPLGVFCGRKLRQSPPFIGTCRVGEAMWNDLLVEQAVRLLRELRFTGIAQVEFKYDSRDRQFKFIEINPRLWQWHENAAACGVDFPWIAYQHLTARPVRLVTTQGCRRRWALTFYESVAPAVARPPYVDPLLRPDDPRVAVAHLARVARSTLVSVRR